MPVLTREALFARLTHQESRGNQFGRNGQPLTSPKGAVGIAQIMPETAPEAGEYGANTVYGAGNWRAWLLVFHAFPRRKSMEKQNFHMAPAQSGADRRVYLRHGMGIQSVPLETAGAVGGCLF